MDQQHLSDASVAMSNMSKDITIITRDNEEVYANKYVMSEFMAIIDPLVSVPTYDAGPLSLTNCSSSSLTYLINIITSFVIFEHRNDTINKNDEKDLDNSSISNSVIDICGNELKVPVNAVLVKEEKIELDKLHQNNVLNSTIEQPLLIGHEVEKHVKKKVKFKKKKLLKVKAEEKDNNTKVKCPNCTKTFRYIKPLKNHFDKSHLSETCEFLCNFCGLIYNSFEIYMNHLEKHMGVSINEQECHLCRKVFQSNNKLKAHMSNVHKDRCGICSFCGKMFKQLKAHIYDTHTNVEEIKCTSCDFTGKKKNVINHYRKVHKTGMKPCPSCGKQIKQLKRHLEVNCVSTISTRKDRTISCDQCGKKFSSKQHLTRHVKFIHSDIRHIECKQCDYKTYTSFNLNIHITRVHEGKPLRSKCEICMKDVIDMKRHKRVYHDASVLKISDDNPCKVEGLDKI